MKNFKLFMLVFTLGAFIINSCSVERRYHRTGLNINWNNASIKMKKDKKYIESEINNETLVIENTYKKSNENDVITYSDLETQDLAQNSEDLVLTESSLNPKAELIIADKNDQKSKLSATFEASREIEKTTNSNSKTKQRVGKKAELKELIRQNSSSGDDNTVLCIVLAFFIPPLAVYLYEGSWTKRCTVNLILTLLCGLPGLIHALVVILGGK
jgi:uncharacterized membrane protein YqaE (UPF0057 family)